MPHECCFMFDPECTWVAMFMCMLRIALHVVFRDLLRRFLLCGVLFCYACSLVRFLNYLFVGSSLGHEASRWQRGMSEPYSEPKL